MDTLLNVEDNSALTGRDLDPAELESRRYYIEQEKKEMEEKQRLIRFHDRKKVDELIKPILSLDLVEEFYEKDPDLLAE